VLQGGQLSQSYQLSRGPARSDRLRILQVVPTYLPAARDGGPVRTVHALASALVKRGHDVSVYTSSVDGSGDLDVPLIKPVDIDGVKVHYFPVNWARSLYWSSPMCRQLRRAAASFDVAHLHSVFLRPTWAAARAAHAAAVPYVVSPRGSLGRDVIANKSRWIKNAWISLVEQETLRQAARLHVTSEVERIEVEALGLTLPRIVCVPNGFGWPEVYAPLSSGPFSGLPRSYALFLGRITEEKGIDRLIEAWKWVPDLPLVIAGSDETGYQKKLEQLIWQHQVNGRVQFIGSVSDEHKWALYENATMCILPSYSENFGNVIAEAMAMGCPVVVTPQVGLACMVHRYGAGVVTQGAPQRLAQAIRTLQSDPDARRRMGELGKAAARQHLTWHTAASQMEATYADMLAQLPKRRRAAQSYRSD
jgi:glycosyltransferase involved in cell wall biosynthesis